MVVWSSSPPPCSPLTSGWRSSSFGGVAVLHAPSAELREEVDDCRELRRRQVLERGHGCGGVHERTSDRLSGEPIGDMCQFWSGAVVTVIADLVTGLAPRLNDHPPAFVELSDGGLPSCAEPRRNRNTSPGRKARRQRVHTDQCAIRLHEHVGLLCRTEMLARFTRLAQHSPIRRRAFRRQRATDNRRFEPDRLRLDQVRAAAPGREKNTYSKPQRDPGYPERRLNHVD